MRRKIYELFWQTHHCAIIFAVSLTLIDADKFPTQTSPMVKMLHPLAEVFGFPTTDMSAKANRHRTKRLCPFNNKVPNCTKDKAQNPLGVCSVFHDNEVVITCPIRFRQEWIIADDAADFFFLAGTTWTTLTEVRLKDADGQYFRQRAESI